MWPALDSCVGCSCASHPMRSRLLTPRSFGKGRGSVEGAYLAADTGSRPSEFTVFRPGSSSPLNRLELQSRRSVYGSTAATRNDWTVRLAAIAAAAERIKAKSFTIDGEAVVLGPDGLSRFEELSRREVSRTAIIGIEVGRAPL
jgi:hypothetical protein